MAIFYGGGDEPFSDLQLVGRIEAGIELLDKPGDSTVTFARAETRLDPRMPTPAGFASLLDGPSPATLTTYRANGSAVGSPVWFQVRADAVEVVIAEDDIKLRHLAKNPTCSLLIFESVSPFRGLRVDGEPTLRDTDLAAVREAIASKYLGADRGRLFAQRRGPGVVLSLPLDHARTWDLAAILP